MKQNCLLSNFVVVGLGWILLCFYQRDPHDGMAIGPAVIECIFVIRRMHSKINHSASVSEVPFEAVDKIEAWDICCR